MDVREGVDERRHEALVVLPGCLDAESFEYGKAAVDSVERPERVEVAALVRCPKTDGRNAR
jgi:hypothetical protein